MLSIPPLPSVIRVLVSLNLKPSFKARSRSREQSVKRYLVFESVNLVKKQLIGSLSAKKIKSDPCEKRTNGTDETSAAR